MSRKKRTSTNPQARSFKKSRNRKKLVQETLEARQLLSVSPSVLQAHIGNAGWQDDFLSELQSAGLGDGGYSLLDSDTEQNLPWSNLNRLDVDFDQDVNVQAADLLLQGLTSGILPLTEIDAFEYDDQSYRATWTFKTPFTVDQYAIRIGDSVANDDGMKLTPTSESGNGFISQFNVVPGDANGNDSANVLDGLLLRQSLFAGVGDSDYDLRYDFDGSGAINVLDGIALRVALFGELPPGDVDVFGPDLSSTLENDTGPGGQANNDFRTTDSTIVGTVSDALGIESLTVIVDDGPAEPLAFEADGSFRFAPENFSEGAHKVSVIARDSFGNESREDLSFVLDTTAVAPVGDLSATSDTGVQGDLTTTAARVTLTGQAEPGAMVTLRETGQEALVAGDGTYRLQGVSLQLGSNTFNIDLVDGAGNTSSAVVEFERLDAAFEQNAVLNWNRETLEAIRRDATVPTEASRVLAMVHAAIYDVANAIDGSPALYVSVNAPNNVSINASVSTAAHAILDYLYPAQRIQLQAALDASLQEVASGTAKTAGITLGESIGQAIIDLRAGDGWDGFDSYVGSQSLGQWRPTGPMFSNPQTPQWNQVQPWVLTTPSQFRPAGPPELDSQEYADALNEVASLGHSDSDARSADQTEAALFWLDSIGTSTPAGHWNQIAANAAASVGNSLADDARLFAELNLALADSAIAGWDSKFEFRLWRPETGLANANVDDNSQTAQDLQWQPFLESPESSRIYFRSLNHERCGRGDFDRVLWSKLRLYRSVRIALGRDTRLQ